MSDENLRSCVFPGSFDPVTRGHMDLIARAAACFDRVTVTVMHNIAKAGAIPVDRRVALLEKACASYPNVRVEKWDGLLAEYLRQTGERVVIRGVRSAADYEAETTAAAANRLLNPEMETLLFPAFDALACVSSSAVREVAAFGGDISPFVPEGLTEEIQHLLSKS